MRDEDVKHIIPPWISNDFFH